MAAQAMTILTHISILLLIGIFASAISNKLKISNVLLLLLAGLTLGLVTDVFVFESNFLVAIGVLALAMIVFEGTTKFSFRQIDIYSGDGLKLTAYQVVLMAIIVGTISYFLLFSGMPGGVLFALILALSLAGTDPSSVILLLPNANNKLTRLLTIESIINTPVMVLLPFIVIDAITEAFSIYQIVAIGQQIIVGVGTGVLVGLILFKVMRKSYSKGVSTAGIVAGALATYLIAENLDGNGVLAVATLGIIFGNVHIKHKEELTDFSFGFSSIVEILVFLLIGILVGSTLALDGMLFVNAAIIFAGIFIVRLIAVHIVLRDEYDITDQLFISVMMPKGIAVAVLIFIFSSSLYPFIPETLISTMFVVLLYSIILATVGGRIRTVQQQS